MGYIRQRKPVAEHAIDIELVEQTPQLTGSSSGSETSLFNKNIHKSQDALLDKKLFNTKINSKVHKGYGAGKIPLKNINPGTAFAGETLFKIGEQHLGAAAADPNNFIVSGINYNRMSGHYKQIFETPQHSSQFYEKLIANGTMTRNEADIQHGLSIIKEKEKIAAADATLKWDSGHQGWLKNYPHVGPGNKILPKATNAIDEIARTHDVAYGNAKNKEDIYKADRKFIKDMKNVQTDGIMDTSVKHISKLGIQAKNTIEEITGKVFYPGDVENDANPLHQVKGKY